MTVINKTGVVLSRVQATDNVEVNSIPVDLPSDTPRTLFRIVTAPLCTGDLLDMDVFARVTNNCGYNVGVGWYVKAYEYTTPGLVNTLFGISTWNGENVTPDMHHMPLQTSYVWEVPAEYNGKRLVLCFQADAHSTAWKSGDLLDVDEGYGQFKLFHYTSI